MKKFVFVFYGGYSPSDLDEAKMKEVMNNWSAWFENLGEAIVDSGAPFGGGIAVTPKGSEAIAPDMWPAKGYTIIQAEDQDQAVKLADGCPILQETEDAAVRVYECMPM